MSDYTDALNEGCCVFLVNDRCALHKHGLKPTEGRIARHDRPWQAARGYVLSLWVGREVVIYTPALQKP